MGIDLFLLLAAIAAVIAIFFFRMLSGAADMPQPQTHSCEKCAQVSESITLYCYPAKAADLGLGLARMDECSKRSLGVLSGDAVLVTYGDTVSALVADLTEADAGRGLVRLDEALMRGCGAAYGKRVSVKKR